MMFMPSVMQNSVNPSENAGPAATVASGMVYKVDCFYPCGTGDQQIDLSDYEADTWQTFEEAWAEGLNAIF